MAEYTSRIAIDRPAGAVFGFVSEVANMPRFLPTVRRATAQGPGRVVMEGESHGHSYRADGWIEADAAARRLRWGSDGEHDYAGTLDVHQRGGSHSDVEVRLHLTAPGRDFPREAVQAELEEAMQRLKQTLENEAQPPASGPVSLDPDHRVRDDAETRDSRPFGHSATMNPGDL
ncbi:SRPBCC family protein [Roseomonas sp. NAR14]|uniref:SRPBCC family protein n=1 Tax=Roseomonas acroporae TaxID=2937791 RepID=A0A9X2BRT5_9PROT|nr:SRPBCC family protein [Roseomonas acroporae]MCK8782938.1 SRPBCC family protein [Roseomonas acroporae]